MFVNRKKDYFIQPPLRGVDLKTNRGRVVHSIELTVGFNHDSLKKEKGFILKGK